MPDETSATLRRVGMPVISPLRRRVWLIIAGLLLLIWGGLLGTVWWFVHT
ncbi:hypothetical protein [Klebsiella aerogenes]